MARSFLSFKLAVLLAMVLLAPVLSVPLVNLHPPRRPRMLSSRVVRVTAPAPVLALCVLALLSLTALAALPSSRGVHSNVLPDAIGFTEPSALAHVLAPPPTGTECSSTGRVESCARSEPPLIMTFGTDRPSVYLAMDAPAPPRCSCPCGRHSPPFARSPTRVLVAPPRVVPGSPGSGSEKSDKSVLSVRSETSLTSLFAVMPKGKRATLPPSPRRRVVDRHENAALVGTRAVVTV